jgi:hypothetical protein
MAASAVALSGFGAATASAQPVNVDPGEKKCVYAGQDYSPGSVRYETYLGADGKLHTTKLTCNGQTGAWDETVAKPASKPTNPLAPPVTGPVAPPRL